MDEHEFWLGMRQAVLFVLDLIERKLRLEPTTAQMRKQRKE